jgi:hypothetical protein
VRQNGGTFVLGEVVLRDQKIGECLSLYVLDHHADMLNMGGYVRSYVQDFKNVLGRSDAVLARERPCRSFCLTRR